MALGQNGYSFYFTHDALKDTHLNPGGGLDGANEGKIILGQVTVKEGDVLWNGQSLRFLCGFSQVSFLSISALVTPGSGPALPLVFF